MHFETNLELQSNSQVRHLLQSVLLFIAYYLVSQLGYLFVFYPEPAAHFWPAAGVSLSFLLKVRPKNWFPYLVAIFAGEVAISVNNQIPLIVSIWWGIADTVEPSLAALLICSILKEPIDISNPKHLGVFLSVCIFTPMAGALIAAFASYTWLNAPSYLGTFRTWWFAISLGEILVTLFLMTWFKRNTIKFARAHFWEGLILTVMFLLVSVLTFSTEVNEPSEYLFKHLMMYLMLPLFLWTLVRFEESGVFTGLLLVNMVAAYYTARGKGPFAYFLASPLVRLVSLQTYLSFVSLATMALTTFMKQRKRSEDQLHAIIENSTALIYVKDIHGRYMLLNQEYEKVFNTKRKDLVGKTDLEVFPAEYAKKYQENDKVVIQSKIPLEFEESTDVATYISVKFPLLDTNGEPYAVCGVSTDITALKKATQELSKAISLRDDFIAIASHELRTPLTPLKLQIDLLRKYIAKVAPDYMRNEDLFKLIDRSDREVEQLISLVNNLLDVSKMTQDNLVLKRSDCDLAEIVNKVIDRLRSEIEKANCHLETHVPAHLLGKWDAFRLEQVVTNLVTNAIKYGPCKPIGIRLERVGSRAILYVTDHGIGISKENQKKIFGRFERAVPMSAYGGLGLGLFIVQQIVGAHKGHVQVESEEGKGSTFIVELPLWEN